MDLANRSGSHCDSRLTEMRDVLHQWQPAASWATWRLAAWAQPRRVPGRGWPRRRSSATAVGEDGRRSPDTVTRTGRVGRARWRLAGSGGGEVGIGRREGLSFGLLGRRWAVGLGLKTCSQKAFMVISPNKEKFSWCPLDPFICNLLLGRLDYFI